MPPIKDIENVLRAAPIVRCPGCQVEMTLRLLEEPKPSSEIISGIYRCPRCSTETMRQFKADL